MMTSDAGLNTAMATLREAATNSAPGPAQADVMGHPGQLGGSDPADQPYQPDQAPTPSVRRDPAVEFVRIPAPAFSLADHVPAAPPAPADVPATTPSPAVAVPAATPASTPAPATRAPAGANPMIGAIGSTVGGSLAGGGAAFFSAKALAG
ncbi:MAG: hypothetical protein H7338_16005, partial [Candidatus Sericytochromatia bacterium]|nr:hypothetical protein [Candidatus Sericytochromatia bacterium]